MPESGTMNYLSAAGLDPRRTLEKLRYPPARAIQKGGREAIKTRRDNRMGRGRVCLQVTVPAETLQEKGIDNIIETIRKAGCDVREAEGQGSGDIDMEKVYGMLDAGKPLTEVLEEVGMPYWTLRRRHKEYQAQLPEEERERPGLVKNRGGGAGSIDVPMESVYALIDSGCSVKDVAKQFGVSPRALYDKHEKYQECLEREGAGNGSVRETLGGAGKKSGKPRKKIDMAEVYDELLSGKKIHEVAEAHGVSQKTLENRHKKYQKENKGKTGPYIRRRLVDFRGQGESSRNGKTDSQMQETEK